uniref:Amino acid permease family protein n=1 Tax=Ganoderma boninense TaxID=34458 RepID=A0A5K1JVU8_9APHY|nr:Amino acid permease family protein [Ganoderma boninense]
MFPTVEVISNRSCLRHRSVGRVPGSQDILVTLGNYGERAILELRSLGISLPYDAGTVVPIVASLVVHGVPCVHRDRVCMALSMPRAVFDWFKIPADGLALIGKEEQHADAQVLGSQRHVSLVDAEAARSMGLLEDAAQRAPPALYDETSVVARQTKQGVRLIKKKSQVHFHRRAAAAATGEPGAAHTAEQIPHVPAPDDIPDYNEITFDPSTAAPRKAKSQNDFQREYLTVQDEYLHRQLANEGPPPGGIGTTAHTSQPLHRIEFWSGMYYRAAWLRQLGVQIHCGHRGRPCPTDVNYNPEDVAASVPGGAATPLARTADSVASAPLFGATASAGRADDADEQTDEEEDVPFLVEEPDSELEDEDGDFYYGANADAFLPVVSDLPWMGDGPQQPQPSSKAASGAQGTHGHVRMVVVVDTDGIHELPFTFCTCLNAPREDVQLLDLGYYPASIHRPKTVFTIRLLDDFLLTNKECKTSTRNYYNKLRRTTNPAFPHMVPDRYKELLRVSRQWRNQQMRKTAGFGHRGDTIGPGDLAVRCPACPQPGCNLPEGWERDEKQWKYTRSIVLDGNFSAQHRKMRNPEDDVALADGHAFMVTDAPYKQHLQTAAEFNEKSTCHDHRAVMNATMDRGNLEATGIGAAACSRHGFFAPHACVDFQQGERQRNMDYILHWIFFYLNGLKRVIILYDIICQFFIHLFARFDKSPHLHMPPGLTILRGIGQFHVHGHMAKCFPRFSLNFIFGAGVQDGEIIETLWNKTNAVADSTRGMSSAHRREVIDDHMNDSNWMSLPGSCTRWREEADAADAGRSENPAVMDIYDVSSTPLPTRKEVQVMLAQKELIEGAGGEAFGAAHWIASGLRIEETKLAVAYAARRVNASSGTQTRLSLVQQRQRLASSIAAFHKAGHRHIPGYLPGDGGELGTDPTAFGAEWDEDHGEPGTSAADLPLDRPEVHPIGLPSTLGIEFLAQMDLLDLAKKERQLREGQLNDALQGIRTGIGYKSLLYRAKVRNASSYRAKLRSFDDIHVADEGVRKHVRVYQQARQAMERLFDADNSADEQALLAFHLRYKEIKKEDLKVSTAAIESFTPGLRNAHSAWFWNVSDTAAGEETQWVQDYRRMLWLRAYARKCRWDEELELVPFEMECTIRSFERKAVEWEELAGIDITEGHGAYAQRQVELWRTLRDHASAAFATARAKYRA